MSDNIPPTRSALVEALELSTELLRNIELNELPLSNVALKTARLARLFNDSVYQSIFQYEAGGYPSDANSVPSAIYELAVIAGREYQEVVSETKKLKEYVYLESIGQLEEK